MGGSKHSESRSYTHTRGERERDRSTHHDSRLDTRGRSRSIKTREGDLENKERTRGKSRGRSTKRDPEINTLNGVREYHIISLVTYIVQVFDETLQKFRSIREARNAIYNRINTIRRFSLDSGNTPNKVNKYFPDDKLSVYIKEKYMDCTCRSYWKVVLDLSKYEKVINFRIVNLNETERFEESVKSRNSEQTTILQNQVATMTQEIQNLKNQLNNTQISLQQQLQHQPISSMKSNTPSIPVAQTQFNNRSSQVGVHDSQKINQVSSQTEYSHPSMRQQTMNNGSRNQDLYSPGNTGLSSGLSGSSILK